MEVIATIYKITEVESKNIKILMPDRIISGEENENIIKHKDISYKHISKTNYEDGSLCYYESISLEEINENASNDEELKESKQNLVQEMIDEANSKVIFIENNNIKEMNFEEFTEKYSLLVDYNKKQIMPFEAKTIKDVVCSIESKILFQSYAIKRITSTIINNPFLENTRNIVLLGSTGVGKSKIIDLLARELESPYAKIDGYNGDSLINAYLTLFLNKKNQDLIGPPIIFIDGINKGIEKLGKLDGDILVEIISKIVKKKSVFPIPLTENQTILFDPSNVNYIIALDLEKDIDLPPVVGIGKENEIKKRNIIQKLRELLVDANCEIIDMNELTENNLKVILERSEISPTNEYKKILETQGTNLKISKRAYELMAHEAYKLNKGAKGLSIITDYIMRDDIIDAQVEGMDTLTINEPKVLKKINDSNYKNILY